MMNGQGKENKEDDDLEDDLEDVSPRVSSMSTIT